MLAPDQDSDAHPLSRAAPALQRFRRLSAALMSAKDSAAATRAYTPDLHTYLSEECLNTSHTRAVQQQLGRCGAAKEVVASAEQAAQAAQARAEAFRTAATARIEQYTEQSTDILAKLAAATTSGVATTSGAALERHLIGVPGATTTGLPTAARAADGAQHSPHISRVWRLSSARVANEADCLALAPVTPTATLPPRVATPEEGVPYTLHALSSAMAVVAPHVVQLQSIAVLSGDLSEVGEVVAQCVARLGNSLARTDGRRAFGMLELLRHVTIMGTAQNTPTHHHNTASVGQELRDASAYVAQLDEDIKAARSMQQFPTALVSLRDAAATVLREYALFFHVTTTIAAFSSSTHEAVTEIATAFDPRNGALCGVFRFPFLAPVLLAHSGGRAQRRQVRDPTSGNNISVVITSAETASLGDGTTYSNKEAVVGTLQPFTASLIAPVMNTVMPVPSFATLVVLASLAALPVADVLSLFAGVTELAMMVESSTALLALMRRLRYAAWGDVYAHACEAAARHLTDESLIPQCDVHALLSEVRQAVCFQYLRVRSAVSLEQAAEELKLRGGVREVTLVAERLIQDGKLSSRINGVTGVIHHVAVATATDPKRALIEALVASESSTRETERQLRTLSVMRSCGTPSVVSTDPLFWYSKAAQLH